MQDREAADRKPSLRARSASRVGRALALSIAVLAALVVGAATSASAHEGDDVRCDTRLRPRAIFEDNYVLDRITECRRVAAPEAAPDPVEATPRPAPATGWEGAIDASAQAARWSGERRTLGNAQYDRSVRAIRGITRR